MFGMGSAPLGGARIGTAGKDGPGLYGPEWQGGDRPGRHGVARPSTERTHLIITLEDALATGRGEERPFTCPVGEHNHPTASVNITKGVWYCYSCHAKGVVDGNRVPTIGELEAMLEPEQATRLYPQSWLELFGHGGYWADRFPLWLCWYMGFGEDPLTGEGTYPVHTPGGQLAGVCRRALTDGPWPKYKYPRTWSASRALFGSRGAYLRHEVLMLVEGAADAAAGWEVGCPTYATYGSGVHAPQVELIARMRPRLILLGFDNDDAGARAKENAEQVLSHIASCAIVAWGRYKDPAEAPVEERLSAMLRPIPGGLQVDSLDRWGMATAALQSMYQEETNA